MLERWTIPGIVRHWVCRKQWLEAAWRAAQDDAYDTLIVLGCGFDTLSLRSSANAIDVDHPATLSVRRAALAQLNLRNHALIEHDLSAPGLRRKLEAALPSAVSTFVLIEGVLMYLDARGTDDLFAELRDLRSGRLRVAFTFMESPGGDPPAFRPRSRLVDAWLRLRGEPFRSGLDPCELAGWLRQRGFQLIGYSATPGRTNADACVLRGESAAVADRIG